MIRSVLATSPMGLAAFRSGNTPTVANSPTLLATPSSLSPSSIANSPIKKDQFTPSTSMTPSPPNTVTPSLEAPKETAPALESPVTPVEETPASPTASNTPWYTSALPPALATGAAGLIGVSLIHMGTAGKEVGAWTRWVTPLVIASLAVLGTTTVTGGFSKKEEPSKV
ncbi:MAG: hypothetical protein HEQ32_07830 [Vampirovibrio sp.]